MVLQACGGSPNHPRTILDPSVVIEAKAAQRNITVVENAADLRGPFKDRTSSMARCLPLVQGCYCHKKNVCRIHGMSQEVVNRVYKTTALLNKYVDVTPKPMLDACKGLVWMHWYTGGGAPSAETSTPRDTIVVLQDQRLGPKMQYLVRCWLDEPGTLHYRVPELPFTVTMEISTSRFGDHHTALASGTSDELALNIQSDGGE